MYSPVEIPAPPPKPSQEGIENDDRSRKMGTANKRQMIEDALSYFYEFRRNVLTKIPEYKDITLQHADWTRLTDDDLNSMERKLQLSGYATSESTIWKIIRSDYAPVFHPIKDYFQCLPKWDGQDHIARMAATVRPGHVSPASFEKYLRKWLVGVVANVFIDHRCANHLCFVLAGGQGKFKSTWIRNLYPTPLRDYCIDGGLDPDNKDSLIRAAENLIINMDDYFADVSAKKVNSLKGFITQDVIKVRRPYGRVDEVMPKICSFIGSTNEAQFLYDDTGDRRFICFEVQHIDLEATKKISIDKVYAQALYLFREAKFTYWVEGADQQEQDEINARFRVQSYEYEMCYRFLQRPTGDGGDFMTTSQIANYLSSYTKAMLSLKRIGQALKLQGYERKSQRSGPVSVYGYYVLKQNFLDQ